MTLFRLGPASRMTGEVGPHEHETRARARWGCAIGSVTVIVPTGKVSVFNHQRLQRPDLRAVSGGADMPVQRDASWRRRPVALAPSPGMTYPATAEAVAAARRQAARIAREAGASQRALADIELAVSEAATNAILHAYSSTGARGEAFSMSTESHDGLLSVWVTDDGQGVTPTVPSPGLGLGLELMARLCERVLIGVLKDGRTQVEMRFDLRVATR
jgi:anti-sigma regulatory factor (Ser/Thr protein kinase)